MWNHFVNLIFPKWCAGCEGTLTEGEDLVCTFCRSELIISDFHKEEPNAIMAKFFGKLPVSHAFTMFSFNRKGIIQNLLHRLKYEGYYDLGVWLGRIYGEELNKCSWSKEIDLIVPIPLHKSKLQVRGYNQSEAFARGLSESMDKKLESEILGRNKNTKTQTRMGRMERWLNVHDIFEVTDTTKVKGKTILIVDDVITSGATMEAAGSLLIKEGTKKLFLGAIASA